MHLTNDSESMPAGAPVTAAIRAMGCTTAAHEATVVLGVASSIRVSRTGRVHDSVWDSVTSILPLMHTAARLT